MIHTPSNGILTKTASDLVIRDLVYIRHLPGERRFACFIRRCDTRKRCTHTMFVILALRAEQSSVVNGSVLNQHLT